MDDREELAALRRLAELEAKAGPATNVAPTQFELDALNPAGQMSGPGRFLAGVGKGLTEAAQGVGQVVGIGPSRAQMDAQRDRDVSLMASPEGFVGNMAGGMAASAPIGMAAPATVPGAIGAGFVTGLTQPVGEQDSRSMNAILGAGISGGVKAGGDKLASFFSDRLAKETAEKAAEQSRNSVRDATWQRAQDAGYVVPPSRVNPTWLGNRLESISGKDALNQQAAAQNQAVTDRLARQAAGLADDAPLSEGRLEAARNIAAQPYRDIAAISPRAESALQRLRDVRADAKAQWNYFNRSGVPDAQRAAQAADQQAEMLERLIERQANKAGNPDLVSALRSARQLIAKNHDVERALNLGEGSVSAPVLGRALDSGKPLSGELETIARFQQAFPSSAREGAKMPTAGVSKSEALAGLLLGTGGAAAGGPIGAAMGALPLLSTPVRNMLLSQPYQRMFVTPPSYAPSASTRMAAALANNPYLQRLAPAAAASLENQ